MGMGDMETQGEALERLRKQGYSADYRLNEQGRIERDDVSWEPSDLTVDAVLRFEGPSDPSDEAMVLAVCAPDGIGGALVLPYGPDMTSNQVDASQAMLISHRDRNLNLNTPDPDMPEAGSEDPRTQEVEGDQGMPGEFVDTPNNEPGDHSPPS